MLPDFGSILREITFIFPNQSIQMILKRITLFLAIFWGLNLGAQDLHFTLFDLAPHNVNPALVGSYEGTFRIGGIVRDQYFKSNEFSGSSQPYLTASIYADGNVLRGFRKKDWIAVGINFAQDLERNSVYQNRFQNITAAYHLGLGKKGNSTFTLGAQYGLFNRSLKNEDLTLWTDAKNGTTTSGANPLLSNGQSLNFDMDGLATGSYPDLAIGAVFSNRGKNNDFKIGLNITHILTGDQSIGNARDDKSIGFIGFAEMRASMGKQLNFKPAIIYQKDGLFTNINAQARFGYQLNPKKPLVLNGGLGYRLGESVQLLFGVDYKNIRAALGYDLVAGGVRDAAQETFEVGVSYIFQIAKKPALKPVIFCPKL